MNKEKSDKKAEQKKVGKFLGRLTVAIVLVAAVAVVYMNTDEPPAEINPASEAAADLRSELKTTINVQLEEIDEWLLMLEAKEQGMAVDHSEHKEALETIRLQLITQRNDLSENDESIKTIEESVDYLTKKFDNETQSITFTQTVDVD